MPGNKIDKPLLGTDLVRLHNESIITLRKRWQHLEHSCKILNILFG